MLSIHELSLRLTILAKSSDLGQMKSLGADACHLTLSISLHPVGDCVKKLVPDWELVNLEYDRERSSSSARAGEY